MFRLLLLLTLIGAPLPAGPAQDASVPAQMHAESSAYRGPYDADQVTDARQADLLLPGPYLEASIVLVEAVQRERLFRDKPGAIKPLRRDLAEARFHLRLPEGYDPRTPAGLLVWCSPTPQGRTPRVFTEALDALGLICVGVDDAGNTRDFADRAQLLLDARATAMLRYHVDPRRVYITGMSGGGKVSAALAICFPDLFHGAVPIVGFTTYNRLRSVRAFFAKPQGDLLAAGRQTPIALMTGPPDFNYYEMRERKRRLEMDGFTGLRMFEYPDMGHVMPTPERFLDALRYVDAPYQQVRQAEIEQAAHAMAAYLEGREDPVPRSKADRAALDEVVRAGPWTDAAWRVIELLQTAPGSASGGD